MLSQLLFVVLLFGTSSILAFDANLAELSATNQDFGLKLLETIAGKSKLGENVFISPFSVNTALSMLMVGAAPGQTLQEIYKTLGHTKLSQRDICESHLQLYKTLNDEMTSDDNMLSIANSIVLQKNFAILESFINDLTSYFHSQVLLEDFANDNQKATDDVNNWVDKKTHHKIEKILDHVDANTQMILMNAIYFKGTWHYQFNKTRTALASFQDGSRQMSKTFMHVDGYFNYAQFEDGQMLELPYKDFKLSMFIFLPQQNTSNLSAFASVLSAEMLEDRMNAMYNRSVLVSLPRFKLQQSYSLVEHLQTLGMHKAFDKEADFSNINGKQDLLVSDVLHKTFIEVNEEGCEAAGVTTVTIGRTAAIDRKKPVPFTADHPFMFCIQDNESGVTLFSGIVNDP